VETAVWMRMDGLVNHPQILIINDPSRQEMLRHRFFSELGRKTAFAVLVCFVSNSQTKGDS